MASVAPNPLEDGQLQSLLQELEGIESRRQFLLWRMSFLKRFHEFLSDDGTKNAEKVYKRFRSSALKPLILHLQRLRSHFCKRELTTERCTVRARQTVSNLQSIIVNVTQKLQGLLPTTLDVERECGYSKFHMGALLIRDGFTEYARLTLAEEIFSHLKTTPAIISHCDRQFLKDMDYYCEALGCFIGVLADLGLKMPIEKSRDFMEETDEDIMTVYDEEPGYLEDCSLSSVDDDDEEEEEEENQLVVFPPQLQVEPIAAAPTDEENRLVVFPTPLQAESITTSPNQLALQSEAPEPESATPSSMVPVPDPESSGTTVTTKAHAKPQPVPASPVKERGYTRLSDYYHGASNPRSWRIADQIKKERQDKEQQRSGGKSARAAPPHLDSANSPPQSALALTPPLAEEHPKPQLTVVNFQDSASTVERDVTGYDNHLLTVVARDLVDGTESTAIIPDCATEPFTTVERIDRPHKLPPEDSQGIPPLDECNLSQQAVREQPYPEAFVTREKVARSSKRPATEEKSFADADSYPSPHTTKETFKRGISKNAAQAVREESERAPHPLSSESSEQQVQAEPDDPKRSSPTKAQRSTSKSAVHSPPPEKVEKEVPDDCGRRPVPGSSDCYPDAFVTREDCRGTVHPGKKASTGKEGLRNEATSPDSSYSPCDSHPSTSSLPASTVGRVQSKPAPPPGTSSGLDDQTFKTNQSDHKRKFWFFKRPAKRLQPLSNRGDEDEENSLHESANISPPPEPPKKSAHSSNSHVSEKRPNAKPNEPEKDGVRLSHENSDLGLGKDDKIASENEAMSEQASQKRMFRPLLKKRVDVNKPKDEQETDVATPPEVLQAAETEPTVSPFHDKERCAESPVGINPAVQFDGGADAQPNEVAGPKNGKRPFFPFFQRKTVDDKPDDPGLLISQNREDGLPAGRSKPSTCTETTGRAQDSKRDQRVLSSVRTRNSIEPVSEEKESAPQQLSDGPQDGGKPPFEKQPLFASFRKKKEQRDSCVDSDPPLQPEASPANPQPSEVLDPETTPVQEKQKFLPFQKKKRNDVEPDDQKLPEPEQISTAPMQPSFERRPFFSFKKNHSEKEIHANESSASNLASNDVATPKGTEDIDQSSRHSKSVASSDLRIHNGSLSDHLGESEDSGRNGKYTRKVNEDQKSGHNYSKGVKDIATERSTIPSEESTQDVSKCDSKPAKRSLWPFQRGKKDNIGELNQEYPPLNKPTAKHAMNYPNSETVQPTPQSDLNGNAARNGGDVSISKQPYPDLHQSTAKETRASRPPSSCTKGYPDVLGESANQLSLKAIELQGNGCTAGPLYLTQGSDNRDFGGCPSILQLTNGEDRGLGSTAMVVFDDKSKVEDTLPIVVYNGGLTDMAPVPDDPLPTYSTIESTESVEGQLGYHKLEKKRDKKKMSAQGKDAPREPSTTLMADEIINLSDETLLIAVSHDDGTDSVEPRDPSLVSVETSKSQLDSSKKEKKADKKKRKTRTSKSSTLETEKLGEPTGHDVVPLQAEAQHVAEAVVSDALKGIAARTLPVPEPAPEAEANSGSNSPSSRKGVPRPIEPGSLSIPNESPASPPVVLTEERRKKCYMWYARLGQPNKVEMKKRVAALPDSCDITQEEVDALPWVGGGICLSVKAMNELFLNPEDAE